MKRIIVSAMTAVAVFGFGAGLAGCGASIQSGQSNTIQSASAELGDSSVNISVVGYRLGRGSWEVNSSTETGTSSGSLGAQKVLVCDLLLTNNSDTKKGSRPICGCAPFLVSRETTGKDGRPTFYFRPIDHQVAIGSHTLNRI